MGDRVLVPIDGSPLSWRAFDYAVRKCPADDELYVLTVIDPVQAIYEAEAHGLAGAEAWVEEAKEAADRLCEEARESAADAGRSVHAEATTGNPARRILDVVEDREITHVIMGSHGRQGMSRLVLGSVAERVMRHSPVPVTVVR